MDNKGLFTNFTKKMLLIEFIRVSAESSNSYGYFWINLINYSHSVYKHNNGTVSGNIIYLLSFIIYLC